MQMQKSIAQRNSLRNKVWAALDSKAKANAAKKPVLSPAEIDKKTATTQLVEQLMILHGKTLPELEAMYEKRYYTFRADSWEQWLHNQYVAETS